MALEPLTSHRLLCPRFSQTLKRYVNPETHADLDTSNHDRTSLSPTLGTGAITSDQPYTHTVVRGIRPSSCLGPYNDDWTHIGPETPPSPGTRTHSFDLPPMIVQNDYPDTRVTFRHQALLFRCVTQTRSESPRRRDARTLDLRIDIK